MMIDLTLQNGWHKHHLLSLHVSGRLAPGTLASRSTRALLLIFWQCLVSLIVEETTKYTEQVLEGTLKQWSTYAEEIEACMSLWS